MHFAEKALAALQALKNGPPDSAQSRELGSIYWTTLSQGIAECVRAKSDLASYLQSERDFTDFGLTGEVLGNGVADINGRILEKPPSPPFFQVVFFSEWLSQACSKILEGDKKEFLEKEIQQLSLNIERLEREIGDFQTQRRDSIRQELEKNPALRQGDPRQQLDNIDKLDELLHRHLKFKKAVSKGAFFSVTEKRAHCGLENAIDAAQGAADNFLNAINPKDRIALKAFSTQILDNQSRIVDNEDAIDKMKQDCLALAKKKESVSTIEIEARITKELDYIRDLMKLTAKRLHTESCPFVRDGDAYFTYREISACIDRVLEFDPGIFHNERASLFGKPFVLLVPGSGNALYDWKNNVIIVPLVPPSGNFMASLACGAVEYRLDADEDKKLLTTYNQLPQHQNVKSLFLLRSELTKDYITWMTSEYRGYKNLSRETRKWFEHEVAPSKNDIFVPPEFEPFALSTEQFSAILDACETRLSGGADKAAEDDLWTGSILNYQLGKFERSAELLNALVARFPHNHRAWYNLGHVSMKLMNKQEAIRVFQEYARLNPQSWWTGVVMDHVRRLQTG